MTNTSTWSYRTRTDIQNEDKRLDQCRFLKASWKIQNWLHISVQPYNIQTQICRKSLGSISCWQQCTLWKQDWATAQRWMSLPRQYQLQKKGGNIDDLSFVFESLHFPVKRKKDKRPLLCLEWKYSLISTTKGQRDKIMSLSMAAYSHLLYITIWKDLKIESSGQTCWCSLCALMTVNEPLTFEGAA